jgi:GWxTD domain-containing protein
MKLSCMGLGSALLLGWVGVLPAQTGSRDFAVTATRFYRAGVGTTVEGFCRVPFGLLERVQGGADAFGAYRLSLVVRDTTGLALTEQSWAQRVPARMLEVPGASSVEQFRFAVPAGRYQVEVAVTDSASGRVERGTVTVLGFAQPPLASDLLLTTAIRPAGDSAAPAGGEFSRGGFFITAQPVPVLTPSQAQLFYYVELYPGRDVDATVVARVLATDGRQLIATKGEQVSLSAAGVAASGLALTGLPPGDYRLELAVTFPDTTVVRSAPFVMAGFQTEAAIASAVGRSTDVFAQLTEAQLDTLYRPLIYLQDAGERGIYEGLSVDGKRNYLRQFWKRRDPTPDTPGNELQDQFYRLIARANQLFREGGAAEIPGWRTDRGRIYVKYGEPDEVLRRPQSGPTMPYEAWKYTRGKLRKFVFYDETGIGNYALIWTNEQREPSRSNWEQLLGPEAVQDIQRF